jgi:t-SNARE complex subunit (syntaxin)
VQSILVTFCCWPLGIVAIIFAAQVNSRLAAGDVNGALEASRKARLFCWIALGLGLLAVVVGMLMSGAAFFSALQDAAANR